LQFIKFTFAVVTKFDIYEIMSVKTTLSTGEITK
jgi:hypothetical protein